MNKKLIIGAALALVTATTSLAADTLVESFIQRTARAIGLTPFSENPAINLQTMYSQGLITSKNFTQMSVALSKSSLTCGTFTTFLADVVDKGTNDSAVNTPATAATYLEKKGVNLSQCENANGQVAPASVNQVFGGQGLQVLATAYNVPVSPDRP